MRVARPGRWDWDAIKLWAPVVVVAAASQAKLGLEEPWTGSDVVLTVTSLLQAAPLLLRRRWPLPATVLVAAALPIQEALGGALSFGSFVAVLVAAYSAGRSAPARVAVLGSLLLLIGAAWGSRAQWPEGIADLVFPFFYISAATALGGVVKRLSEQTRELHRLNEALARERDASAQLAVAGERMRLSRDLHDSIAHTLTVAVVQAEKCEQAISHDTPAARTSAIAIQEAARSGLSELRSVLRILRDPEAPVEQPGLGDLETLVTVVSQSGLHVELEVLGDRSTVPGELGLQLFRVAQEALTNVIRHSASPRATLHVTISSSTVEVSVRDDGPPVSSKIPSDGHGVSVMGERLVALGGQVHAGADGAGYQIRACAPLTPRVHA